MFVCVCRNKRFVTSSLPILFRVHHLPRLSRMTEQLWRTVNKRIPLIMTSFFNVRTIYLKIDHRQKQSNQRCLPPSLFESLFADARKGIILPF